jgi:hypothetical protein
MLDTFQKEKVRRQGRASLQKTRRVRDEAPECENVKDSESRNNF